MRSIFLACIVCITCDYLHAEPLEKVYKRMRNHLLIKDPQSAVAELKIHLAKEPQNKQLHEMMIRSLAQAQRGVEAYQHYNYAKSLFPDLEADENLIETFCWAVLESAQHSTQYVVSISSLIGASLTHDAKAVVLLSKALRSSSPYLRMMAAKLTGQYGDRILIDQLLTLLKKEHVWFVRLEIFKTLGHLKVAQAKDTLQEILSNKKSTLEERAACAEALLYMYDSLDQNQLQSLIESPRAGLRYFACQIIAYLRKNELLEGLTPLLHDSSSDVKIAALNAYTALGIPCSLKQEILDEVKRLLEDSQEEVAITAARLYSFYDFTSAYEVFKRHLEGPNLKNKCAAACALALTTAEGRNRAVDHLLNEKDPFVKVNIASSMLGFEEHEKRLCEEIAIFLANYKEKIMITGSRNPAFHMILPSKVGHIPDIPHYPEAVDQKVRLLLMNQLAILRYPGVEAAIKNYLKSQTFGMTFAACKALLEEGVEDSAAIIESLLDDPDEKIRIQAALILGMLGGHESAVDVLQKAYPKLDRELKMAVLEALGHLGSKKSLPFLTALLDDPFNVIRIIAASSLIQCIYH